MDAPLYPPASVYVRPQTPPQPYSIRDTPIAVLKADPAAWAIVQKEMPGVEQRIGNEALKPHLGNFSFESLLPFGVVKRDVLDRIDAQLRSMGERK